MFYRIPVKSIQKTTEECTIIELGVPNNLHEKFQFEAGQYVTLKSIVEGQDIRRSYSLCSGALDKEWKVGVKHVEKGTFSTFANNDLREGDVLDVAPPNGRFYLKIDPNKKRQYVAFAAGSGITPIYSILKTHLKAEPKATFRLFYVNQSAASIILKEELEALKNQYMDRLEIFYFLTREQRSIPLYNGRIDQKKLDIIFKTFCNMDALEHYFICGPAPMTHMIKKFLTDKGVRIDQIHFELFGNQTREIGDTRKKLKAAFKGKPCTVTIMEGGKSFVFTTEQGKHSVLDTALKNTVDLPFACKGGVCTTCKARLIEGTVNMLVNYGLDQDELDSGFILTCQSIPTSKRLVVNFDS